MIPKSDYILHPDEKIKCVTYDLVKNHHSKSEYNHFCRFMFGQTVIKLPGGVCGIYSWDYERWLNGRQGKDWD
jgi:hypothetical protein